MTATPSDPSPNPPPTGPTVKAPKYPLSTSGNRIVDAKGKTVIWQGVNWFGLETSTKAPHGLLARDYRDMLQQIVGLGFNTIRLPFSLEALGSAGTDGVSHQDGWNADLAGKTPLEIMDAVIEEADRLGLMIILDNHSQSPDGYTYDLWFGQDGYTEDDWVAAWEMLARRYANTPHVVAFDLKNEPHGRATWGDGGATDWRRAAERAGNAVLAIAPNKLIIVEGIEGPSGSGHMTHWWGGNLEGAREHPVRLNVPNRVVYSPHEYGPDVYNHPWFSDPDMASILAQRWAQGFGYIHEQGIAPVFVGEFGARVVDPATPSGRWIRQFMDYLAATGISWTYWSWNPDSGDTGGVLTDDWRTVHPDKMTLLNRLMGRPDKPVKPTPTGFRLKARLVVTESWGSGACYMLRVTNTRRYHAYGWKAKMTLPKSATVLSSWNGDIVVSGREVLVTSLASNSSIAPRGGVEDFGLCVEGAGTPRRLAAVAT